jgi:uncharacterized membrane protein
MAVYLLAIYLHIIATVFWVGYTLFWAILIGPLARQLKDPELTQILKRVNESSWPPAFFPVPYSLNLPGLGWIALVILLITGGFILHYRGVTWQSILSGGLFVSWFGQVLAVKVVLLVGLVIGQLLLTYRPSPRLVYLELVTTLSIVGLSVLLVR